MAGRWRRVGVLIALLALGGCKETTDNGQAAKAALNATPPPVMQHKAASSSSSAGTGGGARLLSSPHSVPSPASPQPKMLRKMGIEVGDGRIVIDTNRTRSYFEALERQIRHGVDQGVRKARQHASSVDDIGIHVSRDKVEIDLNKTKHFLKIWGESMKILGEELDRSLKPSP